MRALLLLSILVVTHVAQAADAPRNYIVTTLAGVAGVAGHSDGRADAATFNKPTWLDVIVDSEPCRDYQSSPGTIVVVDRINQAVRLVAGGRVTTFDPAAGDPTGFRHYAFDFGGPFGGGVAIEPQGSGCGCSQYASGFFVAATGRREIALMSFGGALASRDYLVIVGTPSGYLLPPPTNPFARPVGIALHGRGDTRVLYTGDAERHVIRRSAWGYSFEACPLPGMPVVLAGQIDSAGSEDGPGGTARFNTPLGIATGPDGSLYVADSGNHTIRRITPDGMVTTIAGRAGEPGAVDGPAGQSRLNTPADVDVAPTGEIFVTDTGNHTIRRIGVDGVMTTVAGSPGVAGQANGAGSEARFSGPVGIRALEDGTIIVADTSNHLIRRLVPLPPRMRAIR